VFTLNRTIDFSKKKLRNLQQDVEEWHTELNNARRYGYQGLVKLPDCGISSYSHEKQGKQYIIKQLKTNKELMEEGAALKHCVGLYTSHCLQNGSFIFSLRELRVNEQEETEEKRCVTIEINRNRIIQKKGQYNRTCNPIELAIISEWMREYKIAS
jgi:flagellar biosynthesis chaperone FliJ